MPDIVINNTQYTSVPSIIVPKVGGGDAVFYDMSHKYEWMGLNVRLVSTLFSETTTLKTAGYTSWTPSTTAANIRAASAATSVNVDMDANEYVVLYKWDLNMVYLSGATGKSQFDRTLGVQAYTCIRRPSTAATYIDDTSNYNVNTTNYSSSWVMRYLTSNGAVSHSTAPGYGVWFYYSGSEPSFDSTSATSTKLNVKYPAIRARCSGTYFSTGNAAKVDAENSVFKCVCELYRVDPKTDTNRGLFSVASDIYANPL